MAESIMYHRKLKHLIKRFWIWKSKLLMLQAIRVNPMANHFRYQVLKKKTTVDVIYIYNLVHTIINLVNDYLKFHRPFFYELFSYHFDYTIKVYWQKYI